MDLYEMRNAYLRALGSDMSEKYPYKPKQVWNTEWKAPSSYDEVLNPPSSYFPPARNHIVVHNEGQYMVCRSQSSLNFSYDIIGYFPSEYDAKMVAKMLNEKEHTK